MGCNCLGDPDSCPLTPAECCKDNIISEHYTGLSGNSLKRWSKHKAEFRNRNNQHSTKNISRKLKDDGNHHTVKWEIMDWAPIFNPVTKKGWLYLKEIYYIMFRPDSASLNRRSELLNTCRQRTHKLLEKL